MNINIYMLQHVSKLCRVTFVVMVPSSGFSLSLSLSLWSLSLSLSRYGHILMCSFRLWEVQTLFNWMIFRRVAFQPPEATIRTKSFCSMATGCELGFLGIAWHRGISKFSLEILHPAVARKHLITLDGIMNYANRKYKFQTTPFEPFCISSASFIIWQESVLECFGCFMMLVHLGGQSVHSVHASWRFGGSCRIGNPRRHRLDRADQTAHTPNGIPGWLIHVQLFEISSFKLVLAKPKTSNHRVILFRDWLT